MDLGKIEMHFAALSQRPPFDALQLRRDLRDRLNQLPGVEISDDKLNSRPPIPMITLADAAARDTSSKRWTGCWSSSTPRM